jgi:hypothetical protein
MSEPASTNQWAKEIRETIAALHEVQESLAQLKTQLPKSLVANDALPLELPEPIGSLLSLLDAKVIASLLAAGQSFARYSSDPVEHLFAKRELTREEYYLLQAMGATDLQLPPPTFNARDVAGSFPSAG